MAMGVLPIHNDEDYDRVLAEIDSSIAGVRGTPEGDRLEVHTTQVEAFEARHWAIEAPDPIEAVCVRLAKNPRPRRSE